MVLQTLVFWYSALFKIFTFSKRTISNSWRNSPQLLSFTPTEFCNFAATFQGLSSKKLHANQRSRQDNGNCGATGISNSDSSKSNNDDVWSFFFILDLSIPISFYFLGSWSYPFCFYFNDNMNLIFCLVGLGFWTTVLTDVSCMYNLFSWFCGE